MYNPTVLLCGPIAGLDYDSANNWRQYVDDMLYPFNITAISPLRAEPVPKEGEGYDAAFGVDTVDVKKAVYSKNKFDIKRCDMVFAYLPTPDSRGTIWEMGFADGIDKPMVLVSDHEKVLSHPDLYCSPSWVVSNLDQGIKVCVDMLAGYAGGKNV